MGASVAAYWPGITEAQDEAQPGFRNDSRAWGNWMAELEGDKSVDKAMKSLGAEAILTFKTDGMEDEDVDWVTPQALGAAAAKLREAVAAKTPGIATILASYELTANRIDPVADEFIVDLEDIEAIAAWAIAEGTTRVTLEVNW